MTASFSIETALTTGWSLVKQNVGFIIGVFIVTIIVSAIPSALQAGAQKTAPALAGLLGLVGFVVNVLVGMVLIAVALRLVDGQEAAFPDVAALSQNLLSYIVASLIFVVAVGVGTLLFVVPGIILAVRLGLAFFIVVDTGAGPIEALSRSWELTRGNTLRLFAFGIVAGILNFVGLLLLGIGLLATIPTTWLAEAYIYRRLSGSSAVAPGELSLGPQPLR